MPFTGFSVLSIILSAACIYCLNRSLSIPAWQTSGDAGSEIHNGRIIRGVRYGYNSEFGCDDGKKKDHFG